MQTRMSFNAFGPSPNGETEEGAKCWTWQAGFAGILKSADNSFRLRLVLLVTVPREVMFLCRCQDLLSVRNIWSEFSLGRMENSNNKETINLLDLLSDTDSDVSDLVFTPKKKKVKRWVLHSTLQIFSHFSIVGPKVKRNLCTCKFLPIAQTSSDKFRYFHLEIRTVVMQWLYICLVKDCVNVSVISAGLLNPPVPLIMYKNRCTWTMSYPVILITSLATFISIPNTGSVVTGFSPQPITTGLTVEAVRWLRFPPKPRSALFGQRLSLETIGCRG